MKYDYVEYFASITKDDYAEYFASISKRYEFGDYKAMYPILIVANRYGGGGSYGGEYIALFGDIDYFPDDLNASDVAAGDFIDNYYPILGFGDTPTFALRNLFGKYRKARKDLVE